MSQRRTLKLALALNPSLAVVLTLAIFLSLAGADSNAQEPKAKTDHWVLGDAAKAGFDTAALKKLAADIEAGDTNTHAVLIEHDGSLVYEEYFEGKDERHSRPLGRRLMERDSLHDLRSVTKSVTSVLLGIALADKVKDDDFKTAVARPIGKFLPDLTLGVEQKAITLHHVLTMTVGLQWNELNHSYRDANNDAVRLYRERDPVQYAFSRPVVAKPGKTWNYNGGCTYLLGDVIHKETGKTIDEFAREKLFAPLGITTFEWSGSEHWESGNKGAAAGLRLSARDLAKIGSVYLHGGKWRGQQLVPAKWVELSTMRHATDIGRLSGNGIWGYGYHWKVGKLPSGESIFAAAGNGNQRLFVLPKERIAVTIFAGRYNLPFKPHSEMIMKQILEARK